VKNWFAVHCPVRGMPEEAAEAVQLRLVAPHVACWQPVVESREHRSVQTAEHGVRRVSRPRLWAASRTPIASSNLQNKCSTTSVGVEKHGDQRDSRSTRLRACPARSRSAVRARPARTRPRLRPMWVPGRRLRRALRRPTLRGLLRTSERMDAERTTLNATS